MDCLFNINFYYFCKLAMNKYKKFKLELIQDINVYRLVLKAYTSLDDLQFYEFEHIICKKDLVQSFCPLSHFVESFKNSVKDSVGREYSDSIDAIFEKFLYSHC